MLEVAAGVGPQLEAQRHAQVLLNGVGHQVCLARLQQGRGMPGEGRRVGAGPARGRRRGSSCVWQQQRPWHLGSFVERAVLTN